MSKSNTNTPPRLSLRGVQKYLDIVQAPQSTNRRLVGLVLLLGLAVVAQGLGMMMMLPLKERVPYVVSVEADASGKPTGKVTVGDAVAKAWTPAEANVRYFLARWAENLLSIDELTQSRRLPESYAMVKGQGIKDWRTYVENVGKPLDILAANPSARVRVQIISITFLSESSAMIRARLVDGSGADRRVQINVSYALIPPTTDEEVYRNPIGLWITGFNVTNELA